MGLVIESEFCPDFIWNSNRTWNTENPQISVCMRQLIQGTVPVSLLLLLFPLEYAFLAKFKLKHASCNAFNIIRIYLLSILITCNFLQATVNYYDHLHDSLPFFKVSLVKSFGLIIELVVITFVIIKQLKRSVRISSYMTLYWSVRFCSTFLISLDSQLYNQNSYSSFEYVCVQLQCLVSFAQWAQHLFCRQGNVNVLGIKGVHLKRGDALSPEDTSSLFNQMFFLWLLPLFQKGWRRKITINDLNPIKLNNSYVVVMKKFQKSMQRIYQKQGITRGMQIQKWNLFDIFVRFFAKKVLFCGLIKLIIVVSSLANASLLENLLGFINDNEYYVWHGILLAVCLSLNMFLSNVLTNLYFTASFQMIIPFRTMLADLIYHKTLLLSSKSRRERSSGEITNIMSVDVDDICNVLIDLNLIWIAPLQIAGCIYLLYQQLGHAAWAALIVILITIPLNIFCAKLSKKQEYKQIQMTDRRIKLINEIISGIKIIKLYAWESMFIKKMSQIRREELKYLLNAQLIEICQDIVITLTPMLISIFAFGYYVLSSADNELTPEKAFVSLALIMMIYNVFTYLPYVIYWITLGVVAFSRLARFIGTEEIHNYVKRVPNKKFAVDISPKAVFMWESEMSEAEKIKEDTAQESSDKTSLEPSPIDICQFDLNVGLQVKKGEIIAIVGSVGAGKSSLLSAILGEMAPKADLSDSNIVCLSDDTKIAYVPQLAWIQNATVQDNILFGQHLNKHKLEKVIDCCQLKNDLAHLPGGLLTEIGERGINLSGGQKQRISLARACYSDANLILLDDPLSAVDVHVGRIIFEKVLKSKTGLLGDRTRILVTNHVHLLPFVDRIVLMRLGRIAHICDYKQLIQMQSEKKNLEEFGLRFNESKENDNENSKNEKTLEHMKENGIIEKVQDNAKKGELIEEEVSEEGNVKLSDYLIYFKSLGKFLLTFTVIAYLLQAIFLVSSDFYLMDWSQPQSNSDESTAIHRVIIYSSLLFGKIFFYSIYKLMNIFSSRSSSKFFHDSLLFSVLRSPMNFFFITPLGRIVNRFSKDMDSMNHQIHFSIRFFADFAIQILSIFFVILYEIPLMFIGIVPIAFLYYGLQKYYISSSRQLKRLDLMKRSPINSHFSETLTGCETIRAFGRRKDFTCEFNKHINLSNKCMYTLNMMNRWLSVNISVLSNILAFFVAMYAVLYRDYTNPSVIGMVINYTLLLSNHLNYFVRAVAEVENNIVSVERINEYCQNEQEDDWIKGHQLSDEWPNKGQIQFDNYSTTYRKNLPPVLSDISILIKPREKIGVVGRTGAGKSSLTLALFRLIEPTAGRILVDGEDIQNLGLQTLRSRIGIIPQDPVMFSGSLRLNLDPFDQYTDEQIWRALNLCNLKPFVNGLSGGLNYDISEGGSNLSIGQKQLICLARAILKKVCIFVLDEATASVDFVTDDLIQSTIRNEFSDCTIITIAHRINTVMDSDRILVLDYGKVIEFDSPSNLLKNTNSFFYKMVKKARIPIKK